MRTPMRIGDIACGFAGLFLFGIYAAACRWHTGTLFLWLLVLGSLAIVCLWKRHICLASRCGLIVSAIFIFPLSVFYYHLRVVSGDSATAVHVIAPGLSANPYFMRASATISAALPYRQASLLIAVMSGSTAGLTPDLKLAMTQSGTSYIVGMYGYKIHLLMGTVFGVGKKFCSRQTASLFAGAMVAVYIVAANAPVSALRAGIMVGLALLAGVCGRKFNARVALLFTAVLIIIIDPATCTSGGFLLSFMSLVGIYALAPPLAIMLQKIMNGKAESNTVQHASGGLFGWKFHLVTTVAVNLAIIPIIMVLYGDFPTVSFVSNFFVALPFGTVIVVGILLAVAGNIFNFAGFIFSPILVMLLSYQLSVIRIFAGASWTFPVSFNSPIVITIYYSTLAWLAFRYGNSHSKTSTT